MKNVDDKYTQLFKPMTKFPSTITVLVKLVCVTTFDSYLSWSENFL